MKKYANKFFAVLCVMILASVLCSAALAEEARDITKECEISGSGISVSKLTDGSLQSLSGGDNVHLEIKANERIGGIYLRFRTVPEKGEMCGKSISQNGFLAEYIGLDGENLTTVTLNYPRAEICELTVYSAGELPQDVQVWRCDNTDTDLLLLATHSDDDQLFFAGLLPYYARLENARVRVAYFVSHSDAPARLHELLSGLWECGVKYYPEIGIFPDAYSESFEGAERNLAYSGYTYENVMEYQRYLLEKYRPQVVVLHDFKGEYGHGQHIINTRSFTEETAESGADEYVPKKVYVHLYRENEIELPIDEPLEEFGGLSAFNVSQKAFGHHKSQHWTWFKGWLYGKSGQITNSSQISAYNPKYYGLYKSEVGADTGKNDMLENITLYADIEKAQAEQRERLEREKAEREEAEKRRIAEETAKAESESQSSVPVKNEKTGNAGFVLGAVIAAATVTAVIAIILRKKKKRSI